MIKDLIGEGPANIIEFYLLQKSENTDNNKINIYINDDMLSKIKSNFKKTKEYKSVYYSRNNCNYVYDLSNDSQFVYIRKLENTSIINKLNSKFYALVFNEIKLPTHTFACSNDIDCKEILKLPNLKSIIVLL